MGKKEQLPLTAVILELDKSELSAFVYKRGKLVYAKTLAHTDNLIDDLLACFTEIKGKFLLPSRIILYNSKDLDNESTKIVTYRWSEEFFVQLPRVEIVKEHELIQGLLDVFAEQFQHKAKQAEFIDKQSPSEIMGFVIGGDVRDEKIRITTEDKNLAIPKISLLPAVNAVKSFGKKIIGFSGSLGRRWTIVLGLFLIFSGIFLHEYFFHKALLTILLPAKILKKDFTLTSDELKVQTNSKIIELKDTKATSGKKEVGDRAHGSVTLHNFDDKEKIVTKGTIVDTSGIKFSLDQEVKIASASVVTINGGLVKQPGKSKGNATAVEIGPQGNIAGNKQFKISDLPTSLYFGVNESPFSGGTKKEIKTTAKKDMEELEKTILESAKKQKPDQLDKDNLDKKVLNQLTETSIIESKFDKELGEESESLNLQAKVKTTHYTYSEKDLIAIVEKELTGILEQGYVLEKQRISNSIKNADMKDTKITLRINSSAKSLKDISKEEILKQTKGKSRDSIKELLENNFKVGGFELEIEPKLPILRDTMPLFEKNINIKFSSL